MSGPNKPRFHRLFAALSVPESVKSEIREAQNELQRALPDSSVRWTRPEHFHLTLRFLGNVAVERIDQLTQKLQFTCHKFSPLHIRAERIGFFPERGFPKVIWTSVTSDPQLLVHLHQAIQTSTLEFTSEPAENEFAGHITLGRAKKIRRNEADILTNFVAVMRGRVFGEWTVDDVELMKSELTSDGAQHNVLATIPFGGAK